MAVFNVIFVHHSGLLVFLLLIKNNFKFNDCGVSIH